MVAADGHASARSNSARTPPVASSTRVPVSCACCSGVPDFVDRIVSGSVDEAGRRTVQVLITTGDLAEGGPAAQAISAGGMAKSVEIVYDNLYRAHLRPLLKRLGADDVTAWGLCATQPVGVGVVRCVGADPDPVDDSGKELPTDGSQVDIFLTFRTKPGMPEGAVAGKPLRPYRAARVIVRRPPSVGTPRSLCSGL